MLFNNTLFLLYVHDFIAYIGVAVILGGAIHGVFQLIQLMWLKTIDANTIRLQFGNTVILGLEFLVGADIVGSLVQPDYYNLGILAIVVIIRTILSYFLSTELATIHNKN